MDGFEPTAIPAAWYADPGDVGQLRYWDGANWTDQIAVLARPEVAAPAAAPVEESSAPLSFETFARFEPPVEDSSMPLSYVPLSYHRPMSGGLPATARARSADTPASWLLALWPLVLLLEIVVPLSNDLLIVVARIGIVVGFVAISVLLAAFDRNQLIERGFVSSPPAILAAVPPFHVLARLISVGARGVIVGFVALLVQTAVAVALSTVLGAVLASVIAAAPATSSEGLVPPFTASQRAALLQPKGMAAKILYDSQSTTPAFSSVECEPLASSAPGSVTSCTADGTLASYVVNVQVLAETAETPFEVISVSPVVGN